MLLCIDPGVTTGVAVLNDDSEVLSTYTIYGTRESVVNRLLEAKPKPTKVVIERPPARSDSKFLTDLCLGLELAFPDATWMSPSDWKPTPRANLPVPGAVVSHERDAARMGFEYLHARGERA